MKGNFVMDDKGYVSSMLTINFALTEAGDAIRAKETDTDKSKRYDFCREIAGDDKAIDPALLGILRSVYYLLKEKGLEPGDYVGEIKNLVPKAEYNSMKINEVKVSYGINRAMRMNGVCTFMDKYQLFDDDLRKKIKNTSVKNAVKAVSKKREALRELADFENNYVKLKEGFDKADSPFLLVKHYFEILQKNKTKVKAGKKIDLGNGEFFQQKTIGGKSYRVVKNADNTISVADEDGKAASDKEQKAVEEALAVNKLGKAESLKKTTTKKTEKTEKTKKTITKADKVEKKEEKKVEKKEDKKEEKKVGKKEDKKEEKKVENKEPEQYAKNAVKVDSLVKNAIKGDSTERYEKNAVKGDSLVKNAIKSDSLERYEKNAIKGDSMMTTLLKGDVTTKEQEEPESHFTPEYIRKKLEDLRNVFVTQCTKSTSTFKKAAKNSKFQPNSEAWNKFFENDGGTEYREMAAAMNKCIRLLGSPVDDKWNENIKDAFAELKKTANHYRETHKSVLSVIGISSHVTKVGDKRMETALRLIREASVYEDMMGGYIENGGKDVKLVEKTEEEKETKVLDDAMNEREAYVKTLLEEKLDYSASTKQLIIACACNKSLLQNGKVDGMPQDKAQRALWFVVVSRIQKIMSGTMTAEEIKAQADIDFKNNGIKNAVAAVMQNAKYAGLLKASKSSKKDSQENFGQQIMNLQNDLVHNDPMKKMDITSTMNAKKMEEM